MKLFILVAALIAQATAFAAKPKFVSAHTVALDGTITDGKIITSSPNYGVKREIKEQLMYTIGQLNGLDGGSPDMNRLEISVGQSTQLDNGLYEVTYAAKLFIAWPLSVQVPRSFDLLVPSRGDYASLQKFFKAFGSDENSGKKCLAWEGHDVTSGIFWYYYRPNKYSCPLNRMNTEENELASTIQIQLKKSKKNTTGKSPEYGKVWEDGKLVSTLIFGKAEDGATSEYDAGIKAYRDTVNALLKKYGKPTSVNVELSYNSYYRQYTLGNALQNPEVFMTFDLEEGELDVALFLIEGIRSVGIDFQQKYNERTLVSDYISYSGHSGLGANIRALARMGKFAKDQYQIFLINGCDTFSYVDDALRDAHSAVNPNFGKDKFVDVITNAMPSYFHMNKRSNMTIINSLVGQQKTYKEILSGFDVNQRAVVTGEEDNMWPESFLD
ncbi:MAG: hypothetical protein KC493_12880 [Bacteriovoracaceae bacterium]|nr:hypothetical protein [Bacteriovoracaceae bacterium]